MDSKAALKEFFSSHRLTSFKKNAVIMQPYSDTQNLFMVNKGLVKIYDIDKRGNERTIEIFTKSHIFPITWPLSHPSTQSFYFYQAFTDISCWSVHIDEMRKFLEERPEVSMYLFEQMTKFYLNLAARIQSLEKSSVRERIDFIMYYLATQLGSINMNNVASIDAAITQEDVAGLVGTSRESVAVNMIEGHEDKIFWKKDRQFFVDLNRIDAKKMPKTYSV